MTDVDEVTEQLNNKTSQLSTQTDLPHRWTGSDTNPGNNDGQGRQGTDRSNMILIRNITEGYHKEGALPEQTSGGV